MAAALQINPATMLTFIEYTNQFRNACRTVTDNRVVVLAQLFQNMVNQRNLVAQQPGLQAEIACCDGILERELRDGAVAGVFQRALPNTLVFYPRLPAQPAPPPQAYPVAPLDDGGAPLPQLPPLYPDVFARPPLPPMPEVDPALFNQMNQPQLCLAFLEREAELKGGLCLGAQALQKLAEMKMIVRYMEDPKKTLYTPLLEMAVLQYGQSRQPAQPQPPQPDAVPQQAGPAPHLAPFEGAAAQSADFYLSDGPSMTYNGEGGPTLDAFLHSFTYADIAAVMRGFIQWVFPLMTVSQNNPYAPVLTASDIWRLNHSVGFREGLQNSFMKMAGFFGFSYSHANKTFTCDNPQQFEAAMNVESCSHIACMLECLAHFGFNDNGNERSLTQSFFVAVVAEIQRRAQPASFWASQEIQTAKAAWKTRANQYWDAQNARWLPRNGQVQ